MKKQKFYIRWRIIGFFLRIYLWFCRDGTKDIEVISEVVKPDFITDIEGKSKTQIVLDHLLTFGNITTLQIKDKYNYNRGADIIYELKRKGYDIHACKFAERTKGKTTRFTWYILKKPVLKKQP